MESKILLRKGLRQHRRTLIGVFLLLLLTCAALGTILSVWNNAHEYVNSELDRIGYGDLTVWVSGAESSELAEAIRAVPEIRQVTTQHLVYSDYEANGTESDSEGQLILYAPEQATYRFLTDDLHGYQTAPTEVLPGEVYVSPSMRSIADLSVGDEITFSIARNGQSKTMTVAGYYEDPMMGSSMIGMKGFLISQTDFDEITQTIQNSGIDALARTGTMLHIFSGNTELTASELNQILNDKTSLSAYTESVHTKGAISGFMLVLQNAFSALFAAFVAVLLLVTLTVLGHHIAASIEADRIDMGILKTVGFTGNRLRHIQLGIYLCGALPGMLLGFLIARPMAALVIQSTISTTGLLIPSAPSIWLQAAAFLLILAILVLCIACKCRPIEKITPMQAIRDDAGRFSGNAALPIHKNGILPELALRQILTGKRRYAGVLVIAALLVFFASLVGRMDSWLGADGKGMMDAFNPADHDLGVQTFGTLSIDTAEQIVRSYSEITDSYVLAMPNVSVNGVDYTANAISDPTRFHILDGNTCLRDDEIVLTEFVAADLDVSIGDTVTVTGDMGSGSYRVSGIYSCANDMGDTVGLSQAGYLKIGRDDPQLWCHHYFLADTSQKGVIADALETQFGGDVHVHENTWPGLFGIIAAMRMLVVVMYALVAVFTLIVTEMTGRRLLLSEQKDIGILKAMGFRNNQLRISFGIRFAMVAAVGSLLGVALAGILTDPLVSTAMKLAGISNFTSHPGLAAMLFPAILVTSLFFAFAYLVSVRIRKFDTTALIRQL